MVDPDDVVVGDCIHCGEYVVEAADNSRRVDEGLIHEWCLKEWNAEGAAWSFEDAAIEEARFGA